MAKKKSQLRFGTGDSNTQMIFFFRIRVIQPANFPTDRWTNGHTLSWGRIEKIIH